MQHETAIGLNGSASQHRLRRLFSIQLVERKLLENVAKGHVRRPVDHDPECTVVIVPADVGHGLVEIGVSHRRHGDQEVILQ